MKRGDLYRVHRAERADPKKFRTFVVVSQAAFIDSTFSTVICAPIYSRFDGLASQVPVGAQESLKHPSSIYCDALVSLPKAKLTDFMGSLSPSKIMELNRALKNALGLE